MAQNFDGGTYCNDEFDEFLAICQNFPLSKICAILNIQVYITSYMAIVI